MKKLLRSDRMCGTSSKALDQPLEMLELAQGTARVKVHNALDWVFSETISNFLHKVRHLKNILCAYKQKTSDRFLPSYHFSAMSLTSLNFFGVSFICMPLDLCFYSGWGSSAGCRRNSSQNSSAWRGCFIWTHRKEGKCKGKPLKLKLLCPWS